MPELSTFEDFAQLLDRDIQLTMRQVDQNDLAVALKACSEQTKEKFLVNLSDRVRGIITDKMQGFSTSAEIEEAQRVVMSAANQR